MSTGKDLAISEKPTFSMVPRSLEEAMKYAELMSDSDLVPSGYKGKPGNILVAIQKGLEVGLSPMAAVETIAVINGRASLWGDGMLALVQAHPAYEAIDEGQSTEKEGVCRVKRKGEAWYEQRFSLEDAKRAGLLGKAGPWTQYTKRMLQLRARGFALRDKFADALKGMIAAEEALDIQAEVVREAEPPAPSLKEKLKAQVDAGDAIDTCRAADLSILKADFDQRLVEAKTFKVAAAVREEVLSSDLPKDYKDGFALRFQEKYTEKK